MDEIKQKAWTCHEDLMKTNDGRKEVIIISRLYKTKDFLLVYIKILYISFSIHTVCKHSVF